MKTNEKCRASQRCVDEDELNDILSVILVAVLVYIGYKITKD